MIHDAESLRVRALFAGVVAAIAVVLLPQVASAEQTALELQPRLAGSMVMVGDRGGLGGGVLIAASLDHYWNDRQGLGLELQQGFQHGWFCGAERDDETSEGVSFRSTELALRYLRRGRLSERGSFRFSPALVGGYASDERGASIWMMGAYLGGQVAVELSPGSEVGALANLGLTMGPTVSDTFPYEETWGVGRYAVLGVFFAQRLSL